ncbi:MAG: peptide-methionine (S)-S-oxide reductase MsrA [Microthrixaceae bacterium]
MFFGRTPKLVDPDEALVGRVDAIPTAESHHVNGTPLKGPFPTGAKIAVFGEGCFWGVERIFWQVPGVITTAVGYAGGHTPNPTYEEVCSGRTAHTEAVLVVFDPEVVSYSDLLRVFWESHDPTQGMRQGNDIGTQYRSAIYTLDDEQLRLALASRELYEGALANAGRSVITTEVRPLGSLDGHFFYAEDYHQQYLSKNPHGYCGVAGTGISCPEAG